MLLNYDECGDRHVGYIANMHTQAFQGSEAVLLSQLTDTMIFVSLFKEKTTQPRDIIDFDIVCGDFNADNMSPGKLMLSVELWPIQLYGKTAFLTSFYFQQHHPYKVKYFVSGFSLVFVMPLSKTVVNADHRLLICTKLIIVAFITV